MDDAADIVQRLRAAEAESGFRVLGPAPAPLGKLRGEYRAQFLIKGTNRKRMREALLSALAARPDLARRTVVDVDPLSRCSEIADCRLQVCRSIAGTVES